MKLFRCQNCGQPLYFENTRCERCGLLLGYLAKQETITALKLQGDSIAGKPAALHSLHDQNASGAPADWSERFISAYASSHPWEDFAETWAHYFHMIDTLETARFSGLSVMPQTPQTPGAVFNFHPLEVDISRLVQSWIALTFAVNSLNRSMGLPDLYPFVLGAGAVAKLRFVQQLIAAARVAA
jgi:hypothetical protein